MFCTLISTGLQFVDSVMESKTNFEELLCNKICNILKITLLIYGHFHSKGCNFSQTGSKFQNMFS